VKRIQLIVKHSALLKLDFLNFTVIVKKIGKKKPVVNLALIHTWGVGVWGLGSRDKTNL
jgi:hypothetical protein